MVLVQRSEGASVVQAPCVLRLATWSATSASDASGADQLAGQWAKSRGISVKAYPADWKNLGRIAGPIRNKKMLDEKPDLLVAFPGGKGTANMVFYAKKSGCVVVLVEG